jgi:transposase
VKYTKEQRLDIGRRIYDGEITKFEAAEEYGINDQTARDYMRLYRDVNNLPPKRAPRSRLGIARAKSKPTPAGMEDLESMTREELIDALIMARINEARLKKGYMVEGVGAEKKYIPIGKKNTK